MRLVTFNLQHGRSTGGRVDPQAVVAAVATLAPDVLALQEVDQHQPRSGYADLTAVAAEAMGAADARFVPTLLGTPGANWVEVLDPPQYGQACFGISLISRYPVRNWDLVRLPGVGPHPTLGVPRRPGRSVRLGEEPRRALIAEMAAPAGPLLVANTHLSFLPGWNAVQLRRVAAELDRKPGPAVLMGDLNLPGWLPARLTGYREAAAHPTFPAVWPRSQLDHILLRGEVGAARWSGSVRLPLSDHRALVAELGPVG